MATHHHHEPQGADLAVAAQATLEKSGEQWTTMRANIFRALAGFDKPASAYDIAEAVSKAEGAASPPTVCIAFSTCSSARTSRGASKARTPTSPNRAPGLPARLHLPGVRHMRPDHAPRRRQHHAWRALGSGGGGFLTGAPGDRSPRPMRSVRRAGHSRSVAAARPKERPAGGATAPTDVMGLARDRFAKTRLQSKSFPIRTPGTGGSLSAIAATRSIG